MPTKPKTDATTQHYFASTYAGWGVAQTREQAIRKALAYTGKTLVDAATKDDGGIEVLSCLVPLPQSAPYGIDRYLPARETGRAEILKHKVAGMRGAPILLPPEH